MDYFINQSIHFVTHNGLLTLNGSEQSAIQLSKQGARLLSELITHCGTTVTREELLQRVWEEHGLTPSDGNLSNHISLLRKTFFQLGIKENIIITVPKVGFRLEAEVTLDDIKVKQEFSPGNNTATPLVIFDKKEKKTHKWIKNTFFVYTFIAIILTLIVTLTLKFSQNSSGISNIERCRIIDLGDSSKRYLSDELKSLTLFIDKNNIDCKKDNSIIYFKINNAFPQQNDGDMRVIFLAQCSSSSRNHNRLTHCANYWLSTLMP